MATILLIDDDEIYRASLAELLNFEAYSSLEAENGQKGLELLRCQLPDLIISDLEMPVMNGIEVLTQVRGDPALSHIPFFLVTASNNEQHFKAAFELGLEAYLKKPLDILVLLCGIACVLNPKTASAISRAEQ